MQLTSRKCLSLMAPIHGTFRKDFITFQFLSPYRFQLFRISHHYLRFLARSKKTWVIGKTLPERMRKILHSLLLVYCPRHQKVHSIIFRWQRLSSLIHSCIPITKNCMAYTYWKKCRLKLDAFTGIFIKLVHQLGVSLETF